MIYTNDRIKDSEDVGVLFHAIIRYAEANEELLDRSVVSVGYGMLLELANKAAAEVALQHVDEVDDWDGSVWFERLEDISEQSLAKALFEPDPDVTTVVKSWLFSLC